MRISATFYICICASFIGILDKNRDTFSADLVGLVCESKMEFLFDLFAKEMSMVIISHDFMFFRGKKGRVSLFYQNIKAKIIMFPGRALLLVQIKALVFPRGSSRFLARLQHRPLLSLPDIFFNYT